MGLITTGKQLLGYTIAETKALLTASGDEMTRTEAFEKAWRLAMKGDFSLVDEIYHPDYRAIDVTTGIEHNLEDDKAIVSSFAEEVTIGPYKTLSEAGNSLQVHAFSRFKNKEIFNSGKTSITYKEGKIVTQTSTMEDLDYDPSEGQDWNWEDYE